MNMDNINELHPTSLITSVKKKHIFLGIVLLIIILRINLFQLSNIKTLSIHINISKQSTNTTPKLFSIIHKTITSSINLTSTITSTSKTTIKSHEILCNNRTDLHKMNISQNLCGRTSCSIILRSSGGRLGNRMFMFASAYGLTRLHHCRLYVSSTILKELSKNFQMKSFDKIQWLSLEELNKLKNIQTKDTVCSFLPELIKPNAFENIELIGYWQSYLYFDAYREEIREIFSAQSNTLIQLVAYFTKITNKFCPLCLPLPNTTHKELRQVFQTRYNITWIGIHIRRDDFKGLGYASDDEYIHHSIRFFRKRYYRNQIRFLIASDDKIYCQKLFASEQQLGKIFILPNHFTPIDDLIALSLCHHSIVTGGTFGFWSAYLAGGEVIHDIRYRAQCLRSDYYPPWFMLVGSPIEKKV